MGGTLLAPLPGRSERRNLQPLLAEAERLTAPRSILQAAPYIVARRCAPVPIRVQAQRREVRMLVAIHRIFGGESLVLAGGGEA